ncbi:MAG: hypothetical protein LBE27_00135 [Deltaproteobacteria bacterium]|jgi:hypothetical protein|nr:hypothetical protein [Deltaproteobacteria bacterium]
MFNRVGFFLLTALLALLSGALMALSPVKAMAAGEDAPTKVISTYQIGEVLVTYFAPDGFKNLWGLDPDADDFLRSLNTHFKLLVLGAYGNPEEFLEFVRQVKAGEPTKIPRMALFTTTRKMNQKSYVGKSAKKQLDKYNTWFGLATSTSLVAFGFEVKANGILRKKLGKDLDFSYDVNKYSKVYEKTPSSISVGLLSTFKINGEKCQNYLNTSAMQIQDKLVFLTMVGDRGDAGVSSLNLDLSRWKSQLSQVNPPPATDDSANTGA